MNRVHPLSEEELQALEHLHRTTHDADVRSRCDMILLSNAGLSPPKIGQQVRFSGRTVIRFIQRYHQAGLAGLQTQPRSGRPRTVTPAYEAKLQEVVAQPPRSLGQAFSNWTTQTLADYLAQQTGIRISARQVEQYLKVHGWRLRRPVRSVKHKQDAEQVAAKKNGCKSRALRPEPIPIRSY